MHEPLPLLRRAAIQEADTAAVVHVLHRDYETRSRVSLKKLGANRYAADPSTEILCMAYAVDGDPVKLWRPGDLVPAERFEAAINSEWRAAAHGDHFETAIEQHILGPQYGFPLVPLERHVCTQALCLSLGLPAKLSATADALELSGRKDAAGERLMHAMSRPRKAHKDEDPAGVYWFEDPERLGRLGLYCCQDVEVERDIYNRLPPLPATEQGVWVLSSQINQRGFHVDRQFAEAARQIALQAGPEIDAELPEITNGAVTAINQITRMLTWLQDHGCTAPKLDRKTVEKLLLDTEDLPPPVRRVLELRLGGAQAAAKKIDALLTRAGDDDRVRGAFRFHGCATGRWSGEGFQPQNLKKPVVEDIDAAVAAVSTGDYQHVKALYAKPLAVVGDCSRSMITAAPGHVLIGGDYGAIESRTLAWVAGEAWKLDSYRRFDATHDPRDEPYCETACRIFRVPSGTYTKGSPERGIGKICDLAFGFQGSLAAWRKFEPDKYSDAEVAEFVSKWRSAHPAIVKFWRTIDRAATLAVHARGEIVRCSCVDLKSVGSFLFLKLPSGRKLAYPQPRLVDENGRHRVVFSDNAEGRFVDCRNGQGAYAGTWTENVVSGIARDLLAAAMLCTEAAGYPIVLHIHDELVCELPIGFGSTDEFTQLMTVKPAWALDLPIAASAWTGPRYCK
jgi:DNA polymerase bacteriophage-type